MATEFEVPAIDLINKVAESLEKDLKAGKPGYADFVKTGVHTERAPLQENWWFVRMASILRKISLHGPVGVEDLRGEYGGKRNRGVKPHHHTKASGSIIRKSLQELEKLGFVKKEKKGRVITAKGKSFLSKQVKIVLSELKKKETQAM
ncbi:MAG: 30S ribosomal protein S19e [archaeon]